MDYRHQIIGEEKQWQAGKVVCIGRNYAKHAEELNNPVPQTPLLFIKPSTAIVAMENPISLPDLPGCCHHELELAVLIGKRITKQKPEKVMNSVIGFGLALDLTMRDLQSQLKEKGHPWEKAKAFDGSCPLSPFIEKHHFSDFGNIEIALSINGQIRQKGNSKDMLTKIPELISYISQYFSLLPGDVVISGTPAGVAPLEPGDRLELNLDNRHTFSTTIV